MARNLAHRGCLWCGGSRRQLVIRIRLLDVGTSARVDCHAGSIIIILSFFVIGGSWRDEWRWRWLVVCAWMRGEIM
jgi:hypothetical protein